MKIVALSVTSSNFGGETLNTVTNLQILCRSREISRQDGHADKQTNRQIHMKQRSMHDIFSYRKVHADGHAVR